MSKQVDIRTFAYALEPILSQRQWKLDELQSVLGKAQQAVSDMQGQLDSLRKSYQAHVDSVRDSHSEKMDLARYAQALAFITQIGRRMKECEKSLDLLVEQRDNARVQCIEQQKSIEAIAQHRSDCLADFITTEQNRAGNEADRDWVARMQWQCQAQDSTAGLVKVMQKRQP